MSGSQIFADCVAATVELVEKRDQSTKVQQLGGRECMTNKTATSVKPHAEGGRANFDTLISVLGGTVHIRKKNGGMKEEFLSVLLVTHSPMCPIAAEADATWKFEDAIDRGHEKAEKGTEALKREFLKIDDPSLQVDDKIKEKAWLVLEGGHKK